MRSYPPFCVQTQAWDLYYHVFKRINKQLHSLTTLELQYVAPALVRAQGMELAVPGKREGIVQWGSQCVSGFTYRVASGYVRL